MRRTSALIVVAVSVCVLVGSPASAQYVGSSLGVEFFPDIPVRGPIVLYPTLTLTGEYNDNIFLNNNRKQSDFVLGISPGVRLVLESPTYRWAAGYSFTAEKYADHSELDSAFQRQHFFLTGLYRVDPRVTLTLSEVFLENNNSNLVSEEGISVGRRTSRSNSLSPGLTWQFAPRTSLNASLGYTLQRYDDESASDSDVYRVTGDINHDFTSRLTGIAGYEFRYIDVQDQVGTTTHTPRVGVSYRFTPTLTGLVIAGPTFRVTKHESGVSPYVNANITNLFAWGSVSAYFNHYVGVAGGLGGSTENTSIGGLLQVTTLLRNLVLEAAPRYGISKSIGNTGNIDVKSFTLDLRAAYRFNTWLAAVGGYRFYYQRSDTVSSSLATDVDQNRVFVGVQFGWPMKFD